MKTDKQTFHKNLNSNVNNNGDSKTNFDKNEIKQENEKPYNLNNNISNNNINNKNNIQKSLDFEKIDDKLNTAIKILNSADDEFIGNSLIPYESANYIQKILPQKKTNLSHLENSNNFKIEDSIKKNVLKFYFKKSNLS